MFYGLLADLVVIVHAGFVAFVVLGGLLVLRWPRAAWAHVPAAVWGAGVEFSGAICPLTPLENLLRRMAGERGYAGDFIEHYVIPVLYPAGLTHETQFLLGTAVVVFNLIVYARVIAQRARASRNRNHER